MSNVIAQRKNPLDDRIFAINGVSLSPAPFTTRISLRVRDKGMAAAKKALGFALPTKPAFVVQKGSTTCMWLAPDEWLLIDEKNEAAFENVFAVNTKDLGVADISHRNCAIFVKGPNTVNALNSACPRDLSLEVFPVGTASRTIFGKAEIVLYRVADDEFRVECWRSFADYVWKLLEDAAKSA